MRKAYFCFILINIFFLKQAIAVVVKDIQIKGLKRIEEDVILKIIPFKEINTYETFALIVNTIGTNEVFFDEDFFSRWMHLHIPNQLFIDLGSPSVINTTLNEAQGVIRLEDIFKQSKDLSIEKHGKVAKARAAICLLVEARRKHFTLNYPYGWEELKFA